MPSPFPILLPDSARSLFVSLHVTGPVLGILAGSRRSAVVALFIKASKSRRGIFRIFARAQPTLCVARIAFGIHWKAAKCQPASAASAANPPRRRAAMCVGERGLFVQLITRAAQLTARLWVGSRNKTRRSKITAGPSSRLFCSRAIIPASNPRDCFFVTYFSPSIA